METKCPNCGKEFDIKEGTKKRIIETIKESDGDKTFSELLKEVDLAKSTFSTRLKELEEEGIVERVHKIPDKGRPRNLIRISYEKLDSD